MEKTVDHGEASVPESPTRVHGAGVGLIPVALLSAGIAVFVAYLTLVYGGQISQMLGVAPAQGSIVVLDSNRIVEASIQSLLKSPDANAEAAMAAGADVAKKIQSVVDERVARGQVVINAAVVIGWPAQYDITGEVAALVGVTQP